MVSKRGWELGLVGGVLGLVALVLPWVLITVSALGVYITVGISPVQLLQGIQDSSSDTTSIPPEIVSRLETAAVILLLGIIVYGIGCLVALVRPHGGFVMLAGTVIAVLGTLSFGTYSVIVASLSLGPGIGEGLAFFASLIAIAGVFVKEPTPAVVPSLWAGTAAVQSPAIAPPSPATWYCPSCGFGQSPTNAYCSRCGANLGR